MHAASLSMRWAPNALLSNASMSTSVLRWLLASWVTTTIPARRARASTRSSAAGEFGTTVIASGRWAIRRRTSLTCFAGLASRAALKVVSMPFRVANCSIPSRMRSNHASPRTFTTVAIRVPGSCVDRLAAPAVATATRASARQSALMALDMAGQGSSASTRARPGRTVPRTCPRDRSSFSAAGWSRTR